jgi:16S rRNA (adenine1518-N6/adenine1519-N6)-dimethyltransferase
MKKRLGQHFLKNKKILKEIIEAAELSKKDTVLEVGPGHGELTKLLGKNAKGVIAIEKDRDLIPTLKNKFKNSNVKIIYGDILKFGNWKFKIGNYKVVANIPYYITSRFLRSFLETGNKPKMMVLMVQYEVAKRICAKSPKMNLLALSVQVYGRPKFIRKVPKKYFSPPPKVDSAIIKISDIFGKWFRKNKIPEKKFFEILHLAFQQKRKMLRQSVGKKILLPPKYQTKRPEELSLKDWLGIYEAARI